MLAPTAFDRIRVAQRTRRLDLSGMLLPFVPKMLEACPLSTLNLAGNSLRELCHLGQLTNLQELDVSFNLLPSSFNASDSFALPPSVTNLSIRENELLSAPPSWFLQQIPQLSGLDLRSNRISSLDTLAQCSSLVELMVSFNQVEVVPEGVFRSSSYSLKSIDLSHNCIKSIPAGFFSEIPRIEILDLSRNQLSCFAFDAFPLHNLTTLDLSSNGISSLGPEFGLLTRLNSFRARANNISSIDFKFDEMQDLQILDLSYNRLRGLPEDLVTIL